VYSEGLGEALSYPGHADPGQGLAEDAGEELGRLADDLVAFGGERRMGDEELAARS
jgi:hypothetical protein